MGNPFFFTSRQYDPETGFYHYRARAYDPITGRFLQRDPEGYVDSMNLYEYAGSNPIMFRDPTGRLGQLATAGIGAGVGFVIGFGLDLLHQILVEHKAWGKLEWGRAAIKDCTQQLC